MSSALKKALGDCTVYALTDRAVSGLSHAEQVRVLSRRGIKVMQLREKHLPAREFYAEAVEAVQAAHDLGVKLIINDRVDVALASGADGVHLGQDDLPADVAREMLGDDALIGVSTHNLEQAQVAANLPIDYIAVGPIFATTTKGAVDPVLGLEGLREIRDALPKAVLVAIGGISEPRFTETIDAGADVLAVISDLWRKR